MFDRYPPKSVLVGVDGSQAAIRAAQWSVDEVAGTDSARRRRCSGIARQRFLPARRRS